MVMMVITIPQSLMVIGSVLDIPFPLQLPHVSPFHPFRSQRLQVFGGVPVGHVETKHGLGVGGFGADHGTPQRRAGTETSQIRPL